MHEALCMEGQPKDEEDEGPVTLEGSPQLERLTHPITTTSKSKKRWVIVVSDSILRGTGGIC